MSLVAILVGFLINLYSSNALVTDVYYEPDTYVVSVELENGHIYTYESFDEPNIGDTVTVLMHDSNTVNPLDDVVLDVLVK